MHPITRTPSTSSDEVIEVEGYAYLKALFILAAILALPLILVGFVIKLAFAGRGR